MGRWGGLSSLIDFHLESNNANAMRRISLSTKYHKLDDSIFVLCRNCGHSSKNDVVKKMDGAPASSQKAKTKPRHFLTWSATAANHKLQKMSKTLANNFTKLQCKMEKAIPFQQSEEVCDKSCEKDKISLSDSSSQVLSNKSDSVVSPDVVKISKPHNKVMTMSTSSHPNNNFDCNSNSDDCGSKHFGEINPYNLETRIQNARIVQSHPSVSQKYSNRGSIANPDKILQISIDSYNVYRVDEVESESNETSQQRERRANSFNLPPLETCSSDFYDSGTCSANTSISSGSSSSSSVSNVPASNIDWSRATPVPTKTNLNSSSPSVRKELHRHNNTRLSKDGKTTVKSGAFARNKGVQEQDSNSSNFGATIIESTDETSLLIESNKSNQKRGLKKTVEICNNNKNSVPSRNHASSCAPHPLRIQSLITQSYPPTKLAVTIFEEEDELRTAPWFQAGIPREIALEILRNEPVGSFIVRESTTKSGCFALSLRVPKNHQPCGIAHYLILKTSRGYKIKGFTKEFGSLSSLITHHSVMSELLPCPLSMHQYLPNQPKRVSRANSGDFVEPEKLILGTFTDF